tara:strand:+ start:950 stop:1357 length:408 start_codon:yes stop_codon:yes gene_type:complete
MKHLWLILFVIIGCTSPEPILPQIDNIEYLSYKKPDKKKGWGNYVADILYSGEISYSKMNSIVDIFNKAYPERCLVRIWNSKEAYNQEINGNYGEAFRSGYILYYSKNINNNYNAIKWMQEKGSLSNLFGTQTNL